MALAKYERWLEPEGLTLIEGWARWGLTEEQIAHNMGCSRKTLKEWKKKYSTIGAALKKGKEVSDFEVENALYKRATGYEIEETVTKTIKGKEVTETVKKKIPPDTTAAIFWLKNRRPDRWRDRPDPDQTDTLAAAAQILGEIGGVIE